MPGRFRPSLAPPAGGGAAPGGEAAAPLSVVEDDREDGGAELGAEQGAEEDEPDAAEPARPGAVRAISADWRRLRDSDLSGDDVWLCPMKTGRHKLGEEVLPKVGRYVLFGRDLVMHSSGQAWAPFLQGSL